MAPIDRDPAVRLFPPLFSPYFSFFSLFFCFFPFFLWNLAENCTKENNEYVHLHDSFNNQHLFHNNNVPQQCFNDDYGPHDMVHLLRSNEYSPTKGFFCCYRERGPYGH
jgi:hypothetical protein